MMRHQAHLTSALLAACLLPDTAFAQSRCEGVEAALSRANELARASQHAEALRVVVDLHGICDTPQVRGQRALAELRARRWLEAHERLTGVLDVIDDPWVNNFRARLLRAREVAGAHLATLAPQVDVADAELWVDGRRVGPLPLREPLVLSPGMHPFEVRRRGATAHYAVILREGEARRDAVDAPLLPEATRPSVPVGPTDASRPRQTAATWLLVGGGVLAAGALGTWAASSLWADEARVDPAWRAFYRSHGGVEEACGAAGGSADPNAARVRTLCAEGERYRAVGITLGVAGVVALAAGVTVFATVPAPRRVGVRVVPLIDAATRGVMLEATF